MSPQAEADDFTIEFTTLPTILRTLILEVVGTIFFQNLSGVGYKSTLSGDLIRPNCVLLW